ncbi:MAG: class I SAM-dependent methyltransferase [Burkholderiales bacterium]
MKPSPGEPGGAGRIVPALGFAFLTPLYDSVMALLMREGTFRRVLLEQAAIAPGHEVLDLGCGTGTLAAMIATRNRDVGVTGLDADAEVLAIAKRKALALGASIRFDLGLATRLPYPDASFDRVVSSLLFHHLSPQDKSKAASEARRVLRPGGEFHVVDWGRASNPLMAFLFLPVRILDGFANTRDNVEGRLPAELREAGFADARQVGAMGTTFGTLAFCRATAPAGAPAADSR